VTGSNGFIGSYLQKAITGSDGLDLHASPTTSIVADILYPPDLILQYDTIYHLAGIVGPASSMQNPNNTYKANICGTLKLTESFSGLFVFLSTVGVYEPLKNPYFLSKYVCEEILKTSNCKYIIFRLANPYGVGSKSVIQQWLSGERIQIYGDGNQSRDFVYIDDIIDILKNPQKLELNRTYDIGTGKLTTMNELADLVRELTGKKIIEHLPPKEFEIHTPVKKPDLICPTNLKDGIIKCVEKMKTT
jgi:nucleoside-diphosphate-sugar epimerase